MSCNQCDFVAVVEDLYIAYGRVNVGEDCARGRWYAKRDGLMGEPLPESRD
jgi:hypothetical protein